MNICLLEQSGTVPDNLTRVRRAACSRVGWGFHRLNWNQATWLNEHEATIRQANVTWSEGRSRLYESASPDDYDYYVFIDDDISFHKRYSNRCTAVKSIFGNSYAKAPDVSETAEALHEIERLLVDYRPITGTVFSPTDWGHKWARRPEKLGRDRETFPVACHDLQVQIFRRDVARLAFPSPLSGSGGSMWFAQFAGFIGWPKSQLCLTSLEARNNRHLEHHDRDLSQFRSPYQIHSQLAPLVRNSSWAYWKPGILQGEGYGHEINRAAYDLSPDRPSLDLDIGNVWESIFDVVGLERLRSASWKGSSDEI